MPEQNQENTIAILRTALLSRAIDDFEAELFANGQRLAHSFSAAGHEVVQSLVGHCINHPDDGVFSYYRSNASGWRLVWNCSRTCRVHCNVPGSYSNGRNVAVLPYRL